MYEKAQQQAAASGADGAGRERRGHGDDASAEEDVVDAEVVDEGN